jgi:L-histidine N-alpha-methyltransferase
MERATPIRIDENLRISYGHGHSDGPEAEWTEVRQNLLRTLPLISSKYFYDDRGSRLFEEITRLPEYYQTRTEEALLAEIADQIAASTGAHDLVELGSGAGRKIRLLLDAMRRRGQLENCVLLDINETFLSISARELAEQYPEMEVSGVVGDFLHDLRAVGSSGNRLFMLFGGTIGNLYPWQLSAFFKNVRAALGRNDTFLIGLDLVKDTKRLETAYNDSAGVTADFNLNALRVINRRFGTDIDVDAFEHVAFYDPEKEWIEMRVRARRPARAFLGGARELRFEAGDEIRTEISRKFSRESFADALDGSGLELSAWFTDPEDLFASALVRPVSFEEPW